MPLLYYNLKVSYGLTPWQHECVLPTRGTQPSHMTWPEERILSRRSQWAAVVQKVVFQQLWDWSLCVNGCLFCNVFCPPGESVLCELMRETKERVNREALMSQAVLSLCTPLAMWPP